MYARMNAAAPDAKQAACYERLRSTLLAEKYRDRLVKPLGFWALPNDRRLPQVLLGDALSDVLGRSFEEIAATRGVGRTKIESLFVLLSRAAGEHAPGADLVALQTGRREGGDANGRITTLSGDSDVGMAVGTSFDPGVVSEALWLEWRDSVVAAHVGDLTLGRIVPSLELVPTVIWQTPLYKYTDHTLADIRRMRTHGAKRVGIILEAFWIVHEAWQRRPSPRTIRCDVTPRFIEPIETSLGSWKQSRLPTLAEVRRDFAIPILTQIDVDCGELVARLGRERVGLDEPSMSVRGQARKLAVTRARIYQLLEQASKAIETRWPEGRDAMRSLETTLQRRAMEPSALRLYSAVVELCFPRRFEAEEQD